MLHGDILVGTNIAHKTTGRRYTITKYEGYFRDCGHGYEVVLTNGDKEWTYSITQYELEQYLIGDMAIAIFGD